MLTRLGHWLLFPLRTRTRVVVSALALVLLAVGVWYGLRLLRFYGDKAEAEMALARYDFAEAQRRLASCLELWPSDTAVLLLAAEAARRDGRLDDAEEHLDCFRRQVPNPTPASALQATLLRVQRGLINEYVKVLIEQLEVRHPASEQILEALARGSVRSYRLHEASYWTKQLLDRFPHSPIGRLIDAQTHETLRRPERALEITRRLVEDYPDNDKARLYLAELLFKSRGYEEAAHHYRELRRRRPGEVSPLLSLAGTLIKLERLDEAAPLVRELEQQHASNSDALLECGRFALRQKRPTDAELLLRRALQLAPNDREIHFELAVCLEQVGRGDESRRHLERFKQIEADRLRLDNAFQAMVKAPADPEPRLEAGRICLRNGQVSEGLRWLSGVLDLAPNHQATHKLLADHFESVGDSVRAKHHRARAH